MAEWIGIGKRARRCYGFDEIALVPGAQTVNPNEVDTAFEIAKRIFKIPILAAAMDGVVDVDFAVEMSRLGGIAVLNLDGVQTRYEKPGTVLEQIARATPQKATELIQSIYNKPVKKRHGSSKLYPRACGKIFQTGNFSRRGYVCSPVYGYHHKAYFQGIQEPGFTQIL